jgi:hypothetical protein
MVLAGAAGALHAQGGVQLLGWDANGSDSHGFALPDAPLKAPVTALRLRFDRPVIPLLADYRLVSAGLDGRIDTLSCVSRSAGDDIALPLRSAMALGSSDEIVLSIDAPRGLRNADYRLLVCDSLLGWDGRALDGDHDGLPGGAAWRDFVVTQAPQLDNPNFTGDLLGWQVANLSRGSVEANWTAEDADASAASGSLHLRGSGGARVALTSETCIRVRDTSVADRLTSNVRFRYRVLNGSVRIAVVAATGFSGDQGEPDCLGPAVRRRYEFEAEASDGAFLTHDSGWFQLPAMPLAAFGLQIRSLGGEFELLLDDIGFSFNPEAIFTSQFERSEER